MGHEKGEVVMAPPANPHKKYEKMQKQGRRNPRSTRRKSVNENSSVVVKLSEGAIALSEVQVLQKLTTEERTRRIHAIRDAINDGKYRVNSFLVAKAILEEEKALGMLSDDLNGKDEDGPKKLPPAPKEPPGTENVQTE
jgi:flagellar biosynthesis anti-sigma factor FlgM